MKTIKKSIDHKYDPTFLSEIKQYKLLARFPRYLKAQKKSLNENFGNDKTKTILYHAEKAYPEILQKTRTFNTPMYDALLVVAGKLGALKKGMNAAGISTEGFVRYNVEQSRVKASKVPTFLLKLGGKIYLGSLMRKYLHKVARSATANGWPTKLINGSKKDDFTMSLETRDCQMVAFFESIGEGDIRPYCTFFDFATAESLGIGLKQVASIDSGVCKYCFYKKGQVEWPENMKKILN